MLSIGRTITAAASKCTPIAGLMASRSKHTLPELGFDYKALEPIISGDIMEVHHSKHHQTYITNYNKAEEQLAEALDKNDTSKIITLQSALRFNGGGHINHEIFWKNLTPDKTVPSIELNEAIGAAFGNFDDFKKEFSAASVAVQGSGWGWLGYNRTKDRVYIATCLNQDPLEATTGLIPLLGIDVWEHAYYLQYKNGRANYVDAIFDVVNWDDVSARLTKARNPE